MRRIERIAQWDFGNRSVQSIVNQEKQEVPAKLIAMKKTFIIIAALLAASLGLQAQQTWPMPGAEWTYCLYTELGECYAKEVWRVSGDSLIGNKTYNVIQPVDSLGYPVANSGKMLLTRYENDTVYRFVGGKEYLYFSFNLNEGDVFTTFRSAGWGANGVPNYGNDSTCTAQKPLRVVRKTETQLGGLALNEYLVEDTLFEALYQIEGQHKYWNIADRIGPIDTYPLIDIKENGFYDGGSEVECHYLVCSPIAYLSAYRDDGFEQVWYVCHPTALNENVGNNRITLYPNPASNLVRIEGVDAVEVQVYNALGQLVMSEQGTNEIGVVDLPKGIYLLVVKNKNGLAATLRMTVD